jgi:hypothetical protein
MPRKPLKRKGEWTGSAVAPRRRHLTLSVPWTPPDLSRSPTGAARARWSASRWVPGAGPPLERTAIRDGFCRLGHDMATGHAESTVSRLKDAAVTTLPPEHRDLGSTPPDAVQQLLRGLPR